MTADIEKLFNKYENEVLFFKGYYKYSFFYENDKIAISVGGDSGDIYRADLTPSMTLKSLVNECGGDDLNIREAKEE